MGYSYEMSDINIGDVITIGNDPQRWKALNDAGTDGVTAIKLVPIDDDGTEISLQEYARIYDLRTGR